MSILTTPSIINSSPLAPRIVAGTTDTLQSADAGSLVSYTSASAVTVTIPQNTFAIGGAIEVIQGGVGAVTLVAGTGVTLRVPADFAAQPAGQYAIAVLYHVGSNEFVLGGRLATAA